jgi:ABC-2 type transport system permease protein
VSGLIIPVARVRTRIVSNILDQMRSYLWIHLTAGVFTLLLVAGGGSAFFWFIFRFLLRQEPFGPPLLERLVGIVLLAFFSMLIFSNLIITLTTTYISKETEFLFAFPVRPRSLFAVKLAESLFFSSWAFVLLSLPIFAAYGVAKGAPPAFYPVAFLLGLPFLVIPACVGAVLTMFISAYLPARKARLYALVLLAGALGITAVIVRLMGLRTMIVTANLQDFSQIMALLNVGSVPLLPNYWLARGLEAASRARWADAVYWFLCLLSTALMTLQVCLWLAPRLYYRGWALAKETASPTHATSRWSLFPLFDRLFMIFPAPVKGLLGKDMRTFWRDPAQWSQLVILFGLLVIYIANIRGMSRQMEGIEIFIRHWPTILSFFNLAATCFVLSILTTRFVYPMLSLEGKQYWVIGLSPTASRWLIWEKYGLCVAGTLIVGGTLMLFSNHVLNVRPVMAVVGLVTFVTLAVGLTSLSVGLGALFPNFKEDNPAVIANGLGGTLNIVISLGYIIANIALLVPPVFLVMNETGGWLAPLWQDLSRAASLAGRAWPWLVALAVLNAAVIVLPMSIGLRRWRRLEFHF